MEQAKVALRSKLTVGQILLVMEAELDDCEKGKNEALGSINPSMYEMYTWQASTLRSYIKWINENDY